MQLCQTWEEESWGHLNAMGQRGIREPRGIKWGPSYQGDVLLCLVYTPVIQAFSSTRQIHLHQGLADAPGRGGWTGRGSLSDSLDQPPSETQPACPAGARDS